MGSYKQSIWVGLLQDSYVGFSYEFVLLVEANPSYLYLLFALVYVLDQSCEPCFLWRKIRLANVTYMLRFLESDAIIDQKLKKILLFNHIVSKLNFEVF
jgi:hypothetical protein